MNKKTTVGIILAIAVIAIAIGLGVYYTSDTYKYRYCSVLYLEKEARSKLGDGVCDYATNGNPNEMYNANEESCGWDFGDCIEWNEKYKDCVPGTHPSELYQRSYYPGSKGLGYGTCDPAYNREECGFDSGLCTEFNEKYPGCEAVDPSRVGDGTCDKFIRFESVFQYWSDDVTEASSFNTEACHYDGGDCDDFNAKYPNCTVAEPFRIGDGQCGSGGWGIEYFKDYIMTEECGFDGGDCDELLNKYPDCPMYALPRLGDGECQWEDSPDDEHYANPNVPECGYDDGDCVEINAMFAKYPDCTCDKNDLFFDDTCNSGSMYYDKSESCNVEECGFDNGACIEFNEQFPDCNTCSPWLNDDVSDTTICMTEDIRGSRSINPCSDVENCGTSDDGCIDDEIKEMLAKYPDCTCNKGDLFYDESCNSGTMYYNKSESCNVEECGFDDGACIEFNEQFPDCNKCSPWLNDDISDTAICMTEVTGGEASKNPCPDVENCGGKGDDGCYEE